MVIELNYKKKKATFTSSAGFYQEPKRTRKFIEGFRNICH